MKISKYDFITVKEGIDLHIACVSDLHARPYEKVIKALKKIAPQIILLAGDIVELAAPYREERNRVAFEFLKECSKIAPTYYTYGNHETYNCHTSDETKKFSDPKISARYIELIKSYGITLVNDTFISLYEDTVTLGGLVCGKAMRDDLGVNEPDLDFLNRFNSINGYKILMCHYPHFYEKYLMDTNIDLIISGHAHGGQWRFFGQGIYSPHQGLFPKYTSGVHDGRLLISRGAANNSKPIPRIFNSCEVLEITVKSK